MHSSPIKTRLSTNLSTEFSPAWYMSIINLSTTPTTNTTILSYMKYTKGPTSVSEKI